MSEPMRRRREGKRPDENAERESGDDPETTLDPEEFDDEELVRTEDGELIHEETGLVVEEDRVDRGPEWRAFDQRERDSKSRV
ncbi:transcription initiation factor IIB 3, partial [Halobium palmae]